MNKLKLGVIGLGAVGGAVYHGLSYYYKVYGYDIDGRGNWVDILKTDISFVCVNTPLRSDGHLDCSAVDNVLLRLSEDKYNGIIVIKSTLGIGSMSNFERLYPDLKLVYMPEFLRERSAFTWFVCPDRLIFSGNDTYVEKVKEIFYWVENANILHLSHTEAEIGKLAHNAYIAVKVSFTNEIEEISAKFGANPEKVMSVIWADRRVVSKEHLRPGLGPYSGKCVPKDTKELVSSAGSSAVLLTAAEKVNEKAREKYGY